MTPNASSNSSASRKRRRDVNDNGNDDSAIGERNAKREQQPYKRHSRRTLYIEYWSRTDECKERKWDHLDEIADKYGSAEEHIFATTLNGRTAFLEPNMFPYDTPAGIEHWTLWHVNELSHEQIKQYVENWIDANAPHVLRWNYDDNPERSIDIFHVHVYLQVDEGVSVLQGRSVDDLMHELD
ncbi:hypothetical protein P43SY_009623 [Pythium insidiosum]|uniref:Uncharacterized protein n=1 Tax=Pythium insidiosum TaxID=114742 RepID=A0AAD5LLY3_PYTIN|nr:hypothetical protein P43SY_009623 [Pythium insidiosum]